MTEWRSACQVRERAVGPKEPETPQTALEWTVCLVFCVMAGRMLQSCGWSNHLQFSGYFLYRWRWGVVLFEDNWLLFSDKTHSSFPLSTASCSWNPTLTSYTGQKGSIINHLTLKAHYIVYCPQARETDLIVNLVFQSRTQIMHYVFMQV